MTHTVHVTETIKAPIEDVWEIISPFNNLPEFHPAIKASRIENNDNGNLVGSIRYLTLESGFVREELLKFDPTAFTFEYAIIEGSLPVEDYTAVVRLSQDKNKHTICEWWADFKVVNHPAPDELITMIAEGVFRAGFQAIAQMCPACV